jgi:uncharacterized membrane protein
MSQIDGTGSGTASAKSPGKAHKFDITRHPLAWGPETASHVSDDLTDLLEENRQEEVRVQEELRRLRDERAELLATAHAYGLNMSAMARAAGVNRQMAYELVHEVERRCAEFKFPYDPLRMMSADKQVAERIANAIGWGRALTKMRDERLYQQTHPSFEAYCRAHGMQPEDADYLIKLAAEPVIPRWPGS